MYSLIVAVELLLVWNAAARADEAEFGADLERLCPAAIREHEQLLAEHPAPKPVKDISRPALRQDLLQMAQVDQEARRLLIAAMNSVELPEDAPASNYVRQVDARNLRRLKSIITQDGLPTTSMVGVDGVQAAFLLIAHAETDVAFQEQMLKIFAQRLQNGEIKGGQFALLTDKVLRAQGKPQRYGTQFDDSLKPEPIADEPHVDQRRRDAGMISMANYTCEMHAIYGAERQDPAK